MTVDARIALGVQPLRIESQVNQLGQLMQLQNAQQQNQLGALGLQERQAAMAEDAAFKTGLRTLDPNTPAGMAGLMQTSPTRAMALQKSQLETTKTRGEIDKNKADLRGKALDYYKAAAGEADTPDAMRAFLANAYADPLLAPVLAQKGTLEEAVERVPVDPAAYKEFHRRTVLGVEKMEELDRKEREQAEKVRHNKGVEGNQARTAAETERAHRATEGDREAQRRIAQGNLGIAGANLNLSRERLNIEKTAPKGVWDSERGMLIDPRTGEAVQATLGGVPIGPKEKNAKLTEDEAKATSWLVQAENAFGNMQAAMTSTPSAARPGIPDVIAGIPSMGVSGAIANTMRGADRQKFIQGSSSLSEALLRAATGAGVNKDEAAQKIREITPVWGEDAATTKQKMDSIPLYLEALKVRAGAGAKRVEGINARKPDTPQRKSGNVSEGLTAAEKAELAELKRQFGR